MKIRLHNIKELHNLYETGFDPSNYPVDKIIEKIGLQLGAIEGIEDYRDWYANAVVVKVVSSEKHPNADKLSVCLIDDGGHLPNLERKLHADYESGLVQVVCGAPNVTTGMWAVWLPPQSAVPISHHDNEPFVLESREIRGEISNGMLASPQELDIADEHEGILELQQDGLKKELQPGMPLAAYFEDLADIVIDLENKMFTHRPDCFGELGVARELSGIFGVPFSSPEWYKTAIVDNRFLNARTEEYPVDVANEAGELVPRFMIQSVSDITLDVPTYIEKLNLRRVGIKPVNRVVDWTNYFMHLTGQPLHAYDYDKVKKLSGGDVPVVKTRLASQGEKLKLLNGKEIELHSEDIVIATDTHVIGLAGIMGGSETEVDSDTKRIILECGTFDMYAVRRSSMRHGLFTDAVTRFNKGQSPLQNDKVLAKITDWCVGFGRGTIASPTYDITTFDVHADNLNRVSVTDTFIHHRLGVSLGVEEIANLLRNVEFEVETDGNSIHITVPFWRMDISIPEDIVEEVGRLYGYQNIQPTLPKRSTKPAERNSLRTMKQQLRTVLARLGANEVLTYSFVNGKLLNNVGIDADTWAYHLRNALSPELQYYRPSLLPSLLTKVPLNIRAQEGQENNEFALFELGKAHVKGHNDEQEPSIPAQYHRLALVYAADKKAAKHHQDDAYYSAKQYLDVITNNKVEYVPLDSNEFPIAAPYQQGRAAVVQLDGRAVGVVGEFRREVVKSLKLPEYCAGFEIDVTLLQHADIASTYSALSIYPSIHQDMTFEVDEDVTWAQLESIIHAEMNVIHAEEHESYRLSPGDIYQSEKSKKRRITFHIELTNHEKTLTTTEVNQTLAHIEKAAYESLNAIRI